MNAEKKKTISQIAQRPLPPETNSWPIVGDIFTILRNRYQFLVDAQKKYGDIYTLDLGIAKIVILNHPRHAQQILRDNNVNYGKSGPIWDSLRTLLGNGLVVSQGDFWLQQRRMMQPNFHRKHLAHLTDVIMIQAIEEALGSWEEAADSGRPFNVVKPAARVTMNVSLRTMFGTELSPQEVDKIGIEISYALDYVLQGIVTTPIPNWIPVPGRRRYQEAMRKIDETVYKIIHKRQESGQDESDVLGMLMQSVDDETNKRMTSQQLRDESVTMFIAGYETTATTISWVCHFLAANPHVVQKLQAEVDSTLGGRLPTFADLRNLRYTDMVLHEVLRLRPVSYFSPRTAINDDEIDGYRIPAGTMVAAMIYTLQRHPDVWEKSEEFIPERFGPEYAPSRHPFAWIPFSAGPRKCIGYEFAMIEGMLILARLMQKYTIKPVPGFEVELMLSTTMKPKNGMYVFLERRKKMGPAPSLPF